MRLNLVLELMDVPGQLVKVLEPIGSLGANLVTVIHKRDYKNENGNQFAKRLCDERFGKGNYDKGPRSDFNRIRKWGDRGFE